MRSIWLCFITISCRAKQLYVLIQDLYRRSCELLSSPPSPCWYEFRRKVVHEVHAVPFVSFLCVTTVHNYCNLRACPYALQLFLCRQIGNHILCRWTQRFPELCLVLNCLNFCPRLIVLCRYAPRTIYIAKQRISVSSINDERWMAGA